MSRYFIRPRASPCGDEYDPLLPSLSVTDHVPVNTGLVNHRGDPIMKAPEAIGFHNPKGAL